MKFLLPCLLLPSMACAADPIKPLAELSQRLVDQHLDGLVRGEVKVGKGVMLPFTFDSTRKGNGSLQIGGLAIHTMDNHGDGTVFEGGMLRHEFLDLDGDGDLDLRVSGRALISDEKGDAIVEHVPVKAEFSYDSDTATYSQTEASPLIRVSPAMQAP